MTAVGRRANRKTAVPDATCGSCWALSGAPTEVAIEILETALAVEEEENDSECLEKLAEEINEGRIKRKHIKDVLKDECGVVFGD